ncbi:putative guanine nucleotide-exchange factor SEC12 [Cryptosporidium felis]|nr:putative guanine nucleotide-exchange factor SEC12 [Cryptosporidium felis]
MPVFYADYPIFGLCCAKDSLVISGGGGGKEYGIEDQIEIYELTNYREAKGKLNANDKISLESSLILKYIYNSTKQNGVIDNMSFNSRFNLIAGGIRETCILFFIEESKQGKAFKMYLQFQTVWDKNKGKQNICRFSRDGKFLITGGTDKTVRIWELNSQAKKTSDVIPIGMKEFIGHEDEILDLDISFDNSFILSTSRSGTIIVHDHNSGESLKKFTIPMKNGNYIVRQCRFIENGVSSPRKQKTASRKQYIISLLLHEIRGSSFITTWNMKFNKENTENPNDRVLFSQLSSVLICDKPSSVLATSNDFSLLAVGTNTGMIKVFRNNLTELKLVKEGASHELPVTGLQFLNANEYIVSSGADYSISVSSIFPKKETKNYEEGNYTNNGSNKGSLNLVLKITKYIIILVFLLLFAFSFINHSIEIGIKVQESIVHSGESKEL